MDIIAIAYFKALEPIGADISATGAKFDKISKDFANLPNKSLQDVKDLKRGYNLLVAQFKAIQWKLNSLTPPSFLKDGHSKLLSTFAQYVDATESAVESFDESTGNLDSERFEAGLNKQKQYSNEIVAITNEMIQEINRVKK